MKKHVMGGKLGKCIDLPNLTIPFRCISGCCGSKTNMIKVVVPKSDTHIYTSAGMESTSFYVTLPSNASMDIYPDNTASVFQIRMPKTMYLRNKYEVALAEIQYPHTWPTFGQEQDYAFYYADQDEPELTEVLIPRGYYKSIENLIEVLNAKFQAEMGVRSGARINIKFFYDKVTRGVRVVIRRGFQLSFSQGLADVLGFSKTGVYGNTKPDLTIHSDKLSDVNRGFYTLYVYCSLCEPQVVGDYYVPLLRAVAIKGDDGEIITQSYIDPHYVPVNTTKFDTIEINIKNDIGENVSFKTGKVICKLHFRQKAL